MKVFVMNDQRGLLFRKGKSIKTLNDIQDYEIAMRSLRVKRRSEIGTGGHKKPVGTPIRIAAYPFSGIIK